MANSGSGTGSGGQGPSWSRLTEAYINENRTNWREVIAKDLSLRGLGAVRDRSYGVAGRIFSQGIELLQENDSPEQVKDSITTSSLLHCQGLLSYYNGSFSNATKHLEDALKLLTETSNFAMVDDQYIDLGGILVDLAIIHMHCGNLEAAEKLLRRCQFMVKKAYRVNNGLLALVNIAVAEMNYLQNNVDDAINVAQDAVEYIDSAEKQTAPGCMPMRDFAGVPVKNSLSLLLAKYFLSSGDLDGAKLVLEECDMEDTNADYATDPSLLCFRAKVHSYFGILNMLQDDISKSQERFEKANKEMIYSTGNASLESAITIHNSAVFTENPEKAEAFYTQAIDIFRNQNSMKLADIARHNSSSVRYWAEYIKEEDISFQQRLIQDDKYGHFGQTVKLNPFLSVKQLFFPGAPVGGSLRMVPQIPHYSFSGQKP